jgi:uncharacterized phage protein gp47/JayE
VLTAGVTLPAVTISANTAGFAASGSIRVGTQDVAYTGKTSSTFTGATGGTGTYLTGERVAQDFGKGNGLAPIGAVVTVRTVTAVTVTTTAVIAPKAGYSLTGAGGTIPLQDEIVAAINGYISALTPGADVILTQVIAVIAKVTGVDDLSGVLLNGSAANVSIGSTQVASPGTPALS